MLCYTQDDANAEGGMYSIRRIYQLPTYTYRYLYLYITIYLYIYI